MYASKRPSAESAESLAGSAQFSYEALPMRVVFGAGTLARLRDEVDRLHLLKCLVLCSPGQEPLGEQAADLLGSSAGGVFPHARMHVPIETAKAAIEAATRAGADSCLAIGGGSAVGLGKAVALKCGLPVIAVPTTYAGSEMTPIWGMTQDHRKTTGRDRKVLPRSVIYDPRLTVGLSAKVSAESGMNAIAHAVEALYAPDESRITSLWAADAIAGFVAALPRVVRDGADLEGRTVAMRSAWLSGACLGVTTMGLHHKLCHVLGGTFDLPHAATHAALLPYVVAYMVAWDSNAATALRWAFGGDPARSLHELAGKIGAPRTLYELGVRETQLSTVIDQTTRSIAISPDDLRILLHSALFGEYAAP